MPQSDRKAVSETAVTATLASVICQKMTHWTSIVLPALPSMVDPVVRTRQMANMQTERQRKVPRMIFWLKRILTFQRRPMGTATTGEGGGGLALWRM